MSGTSIIAQFSMPLSVHNSMLRLSQGPYLDPHCTFFSKKKSADICKDWVRGLTKKSDQRRSSLQVKQYNTGIYCRQKNATKFMRAVAYQLLSHFKSTDERTPTELPLCR